MVHTEAGGKQCEYWFCNGPNLNLLGGASRISRGRKTLADVNAKLEALARSSAPSW